MPSAPSTDTVPERPIARIWPWALRVLWAVLPFTVGSMWGAALASHSRPVQLVGTTLTWIGWALGLLVTLVPHPIGLTTIRLLSPGPSAIAVWSWLGGHTGLASWRIGLGLAGAALVTMAIASAETGEWAVDGPAYPNEARFPLRPAATLLPVIVLVGAAVLAGVVTGPLLLAAKAWVPGAIATVAGAGAVFVGSRSLHQLSRRFVVFVPAGFVVHDLMALREPVLFKKGLIEAISAAHADTDALDLTLGAPGLALEVRLHEKVEIARLSPDRKSADLGSTARFMIVPSRPGRVLTEAGRRRLSTRPTTTHRDN